MMMLKASRDLLRTPLQRLISEGAACVSNPEKNCLSRWLDARVFWPYRRIRLTKWEINRLSAICIQTHRRTTVCEASELLAVCFKCRLGTAANELLALLTVCVLAGVSSQLILHRINCPKDDVHFDLEPNKTYRSGFLGHRWQHQVEAAKLI